ncbi:MAG TPA: LysR family transcriptional regulator, partial [Candidatus Avacidaminococcus intestinavium]|nr:LysR family transcriptional regulator [Candidatus Avacidaminococcus intestinavium]
MPMTIRHLKIFVAVNDCGGMSAAARKLYVAQPTISQAIAELEKYYGRCLFERFGKKLYITDDGKELLLYARHLLDLFEKMEREFKGNAKINKIVVGATLTIGETIMPEMVKAFKEFKPSIKCEIIIKNTCDIEKMLLASELDCAIVEGALSSQELLCQRLKTDDVILACGKTH